MMMLSEKEISRPFQPDSVLAISHIRTGLILFLSALFSLWIKYLGGVKSLW